MNGFIQKNYKTLIQGGIITVLVAMVFIKTGYIIFDVREITDPLFIFKNSLSFVLCWGIFSFLIYQFSFYKILGLVGLLLTVAVTDFYLAINENPITIPLLILFWLSVAYLILPQFFKKFKIAILSIYGLIITYYVFDFVTTPSYGGVHRMNFSIFWLMPIPIFAALWVYEQWRWLKTLQADKAKAELALLKSQINPHFFFNTLNNLYGLVVEKSPQAPEVVLKLSDMMRYTIYEGKEDLVNLTDEINYLETYIDLHKMRYRQKVDIQFTHQVETAIQVAPLLFIFLLENAFKHGLERLTENAYIHLDLKTKDNQVFFTIENNYDPNASNQKAGIGMDNLKQRLSYIYPNRHELKIQKTDDTYKAHLTLNVQA